MRIKALNAVLAIVATVFVAAQILPAQAEDPSATVTLKSTSIAIGIGVQWGSGTLTLKDGTTHEFSVKGLSVVDLGVSGIEATGNVYRMKDVADFAGDYSAVAASATLGEASAGELEMNNKNGVTLKLKSKAKGIQLTAALNGVVISMK